ncbi:disease resistance protein RPM1-like [Gastrolobium bilobum]|uniref:disease resistance protein RPM1-like n=1 Tax=Gastrolobium bilobum TaxID=150636 RepID=UPI002AB01860|nr:disease resistance protein RPM1-like [Gastrolobium bilobum]
MLDTVWPFARDYVFPLIMGAVNMIRGVRNEIDDIQNELGRFEAFINEQDRKAEAEDDETRDRIINRVKLVREAVFRMEDVIDEYVSGEEQQHQPSDPGCVVLPCEPVDHFIKTMIPRLQIASKINGVKSQVHEIKERYERDGFPIQSSLEQPPESSRGNQDLASHYLKELPLYIEEADVVGFEAPKAALIGLLVKGRAKRTIVSLVGMGGQGKTTLAKKVFDNKEVIGHFNCHAWVTVSQSYTGDGLLRDMLQQFCNEKEENKPANISTMNRASLIKEVRRYLRQNRYVIFFDDVWNEHFWDQIQFALIDDKNGSRIFITTRDMRVASCCKKTSFVELHELQPLTPEKSLELFCRKAFGSDPNECCPQDLMGISSEIVKKCEGLPLAIVAIGGLLSTKDKYPLEWELFSQDLSLELKKNSHIDAVTKILALSYYDLPYYLKHCFLYFGIYPEDYEVKVKRLFRQWVAEGFVKKEGEKTLEDIAKKYLTELVNRSLVQVSSFTIDGKIRSCRVHDLLRDMIHRKSNDLSFCHFIGKDGELDSSGIIRRLSISRGAFSSMSSTENMRSIESSDIRSLFVFEGEDLPDEFVRRILTKHNPLKLLDFQDERRYFEKLQIEESLLEFRNKQLDCFIESLGDFIHLKYLSLKSAIKLTNLPKSIGKLQNLETLDIRGTYLHELPREISKLKKLRHLLLSDKTSLIQLEDCIGLMTSLQTLKEVNADGVGVNLFRELGKLRQVRELRITGVREGVREEHKSALYYSINEMRDLEKLYIMIGYGIDFPFPPRKLQKLVKLSLTSSSLTDDLMKSLQHMPNLYFLSLRCSGYKGESLHFQEGEFQKLKELYLEGLLNLNSIFIDEGALPSLEKFRLYRTRDLKTVPSGIQYLKKLEVLNMVNMSTEFYQSIEADGGEEHPILKHVPLVRITAYHQQRVEKTLIIQHSRS